MFDDIKNKKDSKTPYYDRRHSSIEDFQQANNHKIKSSHS
jgi:hypothetical protein